MFFSFFFFSTFSAEEKREENCEYSLIDSSNINKSFLNVFLNENKIFHFFSKNKLNLCTQNIENEIYYNKRPVIQYFEEISINNCEFLNCKTFDSGGALFIEKTFEEVQNVYFSQNKFINCFAHNRGGCIFLVGCNTNLTTTCFSNSYSQLASSFLIVGNNIKTDCSLCSVSKNGFMDTKAREETFWLTTKFAALKNMNVSNNICSDSYCIGFINAYQSIDVKFSSFADCNGNSGYFTKCGVFGMFHNYINFINITKFRGWESVVSSGSSQIFSDLIMLKCSFPFFSSSINFECFIKNSYIDFNNKTSKRVRILSGKWNLENVKYTSVNTLVFTMPDKRICNFVSPNATIEIKQQQNNKNFDDLPYFLEKTMIYSSIFGALLIFPYKTLFSLFKSKKRTEEDLEIRQPFAKYK